MLALLTTLALTVSTGELSSPDATGDADLAVSTVESGAVDPYAQGDPPPDDPPMDDPPMDDPPMDDPPSGDPPSGDPPPEMMPNDPPAITGFIASVTPGHLLVVEGVVVDEDPPTCMVTIGWLDSEYSATPNGDGSFYWTVGLEEDDSGWVTAVATDSGGEQSVLVEDLITTY